MAIATINGDSWSPPGVAHETDLSSAGRPEVRTAAAALTSATQPPTQAVVSHLAGWAPAAPVPFYKPMPASTSFALRPEAFAPALRGYAPSSSAQQATGSLSSAASASAAKAKTSAKSASTKSTATKSSSTKSTTTKSTTSRELAFLDDKSLSIEEKLFQFMALMTKKNDQELVDAMKEYEGKKAAQSSTSNSSEKSSTSSEKSSSSSGPKPLLNPDGGGGLFGFLGDALGGIGKAIVGGAESLAKDLGGPVLAGVATAVGMPFLAPVALQIGGGLSAGLIDTVASTVGLGKSSTSPTSGAAAKSSGSSTGTKATSSSTKKTSTPAKTSTAADPEGFDEKLEMFKLQRLVEKQNAMFSALTNAMKSMHESQMTAVQNIR
jgi:hypothetical protein